MIFKVLRKQNNSEMCFVCGIHNDAGLNTSYYELEKERLIGVFKGHELHQSYPMRMHGGIIAALLDETIGRAIQIHDENIWGVTVDLNIRYQKPVPLDQTLYAVGYITNIKSRMFEGEGYICDENKVILATAKAKYFIKHVNEIVDNIDFVKEQWIYVEDQEDSKTLSFDLPK
jgi:uncharacterized protein (TIGR00369 family)